MPAPSFISENETAWNSNTSPKTTASFNIQAGDVLVAFASPEDPTSVTISDNTSGALTWTLHQDVNFSSFTRPKVWTAIGDSSRSMTVTFTNASGSWYGGNVLVFRGSDGVGASVQNHVAESAPTVNITTTQANSAIVVVNGDWDATDGASRTWRANAGALTEVTYHRDSVHYAVYGGYHADAGSIGTYACGLTAPTGQDFSIIAIEIKGTSSGGSASRPPFLRVVAPAIPLD